MDDRFFEYQGKIYPDFIRRGNHAQYILPVAKQFCKGRGVDVGCAKEEWAFPGSDKCDLNMPLPWNDALKIPADDGTYDFVFSSHCLEHIDDYFAALVEWTRVLKTGGALFLYLPSVECEYWRPCNDRKHKHVLHGDDIVIDLNKLSYSNVLCSGVDLAYSYCVVGTK